MLLWFLHWFIVVSSDVSLTCRWLFLEAVLAKHPVPNLEVEEVVGGQWWFKDFMGYPQKGSLNGTHFGGDQAMMQIYMVNLRDLT